MKSSDKSSGFWSDLRVKTRLLPYVCCRTDARDFQDYIDPTPPKESERENGSMIKENGTGLTILVVEDVHETRDGIEKLLQVDGYRVAVARDEQDAIESAQRLPPDLILVSLAGLPREVTVTARRIREHAAIGEDVPVVVFCVEEIAEGDEVAIGRNVHVTRPDNFNQLRGLLTRLLHQVPRAA